MNQIVGKNGRVQRRVKVQQKEVREERKRFEEIPIGQLLDFEGDTGQMGDVSESLRDLETLTFDDTTSADNSTPSMPSYTASPTMSTLSTNTSSFNQKPPSPSEIFTSPFRSLGSAADRRSPSSSHPEPVLAPVKAHPSDASPSTLPFEHIIKTLQMPHSQSSQKTGNSTEDASASVSRKLFDKSQYNTSSAAVPDADPTFPRPTNQLKIGTLLDLGISPEVNEMIPQLKGPTLTSMDELAGLQFSAPEEAVVFQPRHHVPQSRQPPRTTVDRESADRAFQMFSMGLMGGKKFGGK